jgi:sporulation protein YunB
VPCPDVFNIKLEKMAGVISILRFRIQQRRTIPFKLPGKPHLLWMHKVLIFLFISALSFLFVDYRLRPALIHISQAKARQIATRAINNAIQHKISQNLRYEDLIAVKVDNRGRVVLIQPNTGEINRLASQATIEVQEKLRRVVKEKARIPLGQIVNSSVLGGLGPMIPITIIPVGTVESRVYDTFEHAGINQTRHKIYLEVKSNVKIIVPLISSSVLVRTEVPLTEAIIMGEVPQVYFGGSPMLTVPQGLATPMPIPEQRKTE